MASTTTVECLANTRTHTLSLRGEFKEKTMDFLRWTEGLFIAAEPTRNSTPFKLKMYQIWKTGENFCGSVDGQRCCESVLFSCCHIIPFFYLSCQWSCPSPLRLNSLHVLRPRSTVTYVYGAGNAGRNLNWWNCRRWLNQKPTSSIQPRPEPHICWTNPRFDSSRLFLEYK